MNKVWLVSIAMFTPPGRCYNYIMEAKGIFHSQFAVYSDETKFNASNMFYIYTHELHLYFSQSATFHSQFRIVTSKGFGTVHIFGICYYDMSFKLET